MILVINLSHFKFVINTVVSSSLSQSTFSHSNTLQMLKFVKIKNGNSQNPKIIEKKPKL